MRERGYALVPGIGLLMFAGALGAWAWAGWTEPLLVLVGIAGLCLSIMALYKRSLGAIIEIILHRTLIFAGTVKGLFMPAPPADNYPMDHDVLRNHLLAAPPCGRRGGANIDT
jgi:hypothetical protein